MFSGLFNSAKLLINRIAVPEILQTRLSSTDKSPRNKHFFQWKNYPHYVKVNRRRHKKKENQISAEENNAKPAQEWWDYDGVGKYKSRHHGYPVNMMLRDVQNRRIFEKFHEERIRINAIWKNDILPQEIKDLAYQQIQKHPRASTVLRINRRCTVTGKARGNFHQFRVSRFVFRNEADYNKISGVQRAHWSKNIDIKP